MKLYKIFDKIIIIIFILFLIYTTFLLIFNINNDYNNNNNKNNKELEIKNNIENDKIFENNKDIKITAILINDNQIDFLKKNIEKLLKYDFINEIFILNFDNIIIKKENYCLLGLILYFF
jgi:Na+/H+ antiporter NhaC